MTPLNIIVGKYQRLVELYRAQASQDDIDNLELEIENDPAVLTDLGVSECVKFANLLLNQPLVYLKLMEGYVYYVTFPQANGTVKVTKKIQSLFQKNQYEVRKIQSITQGNDKFVLTQPIDLPLACQEAARIYDQYLSDFHNHTVAEINIQIDFLVALADDILGQNVGGRALKACRDAVYSGSSLNLTTFVGCQNSMLPPGTCTAPELLKTDLLNAVLPQSFVQV